MEMYIEKGESRMECELKIAAKYNRPFQILREKEIHIGGFLGLFSKHGVQVEFIFPPARNKNTASSAGLRYVQDSHEAQEEEKRKIISAANNARNKEIASRSAYDKGKEDSKELLDTLKGLLEKVENIGAEGKKEEHPAFVRIEKLLKLNDFSDHFIKETLDRMRKDLTLDQLDNPDIVQDNVLEWIGESIGIYNDDAASADYAHRPKIMVLVGPTGVGKTTTIAKLAAIYGIETEEIPALNVKMITIDAFRIGAREQLEKMGDIMQIPVCCVINKQDLKKEIVLHSNDADLFLIDTIGKSPKEASKLGEMKEILEGLGKSAEYHLVISAGTKTSDIEGILRQFEPFNYKSVILTKTDETDHFGNIISALAEKRKSLSYITCGQTVPVDIKRASVVNFLINLEGFKVDREKIDKRFPSGDADQFKWK